MQISRVQKMLGDEFGTASNIKSRVNRQSVLGAITSAQQRLKLYNRVRISTASRGLVAARVASALCLVKVDVSAAVCRLYAFTVPGPTVGLVASLRPGLVQLRKFCSRGCAAGDAHALPIHMFSFTGPVLETQQARVRAQVPPLKWSVFCARRHGNGME